MDGIHLYLDYLRFVAFEVLETIYYDIDMLLADLNFNVSKKYPQSVSSRSGLSPRLENYNLER